MPIAPPSRRDFIASSTAAAAALALGRLGFAQATQPAEEIIDIHQHTTYWGRCDDALLHHQKMLGVSRTILLPAGTPVKRPSTHMGKSNGLLAAAGPIDTVIPIAAQHPGEYYYCGNEVPDLDGAAKVVEAQLKNGAIGIGEQKFNVPCTSSAMQSLYEVAGEFGVPIVMHFQYEMFNTSYADMESMIRKYPKVNFIGHAMLFWANIDAKCDQKTAYPRGKVTPGGLTDRWLSDYPNFFGDLSAGSGLNAMTRDEDHARGFMERHQDKLLYGSDCPDPAGHGPTCTGSQQIACVQRLASAPVRKKLFSTNARRLFKI